MARLVSSAAPDYCSCRDHVCLFLQDGVSTIPCEVPCGRSLNSLYMRHVPIGADNAHSIVSFRGLSGQVRALTSARHTAGECPLITQLPRHEAWVLGSPVLSSGDSRSDPAVVAPRRSCRGCARGGRQRKGRGASGADRAPAFARSAEPPARPHNVARPVQKLIRAPKCPQRDLRGGRHPHAAARRLPATPYPLSPGRSRQTPCRERTPCLGRHQRCARPPGPAQDSGL